MGSEVRFRVLADLTPSGFGTKESVPSFVDIPLTVDPNASIRSVFNKLLRPHLPDCRLSPDLLQMLGEEDEEDGSETVGNDTARRMQDVCFMDSTRCMLIPLDMSVEVAVLVWGSTIHVLSEEAGLEAARAGEKAGSPALVASASSTSATGPLADCSRSSHSAPCSREGEIEGASQRDSHHAGIASVRKSQKQRRDKQTRKKGRDGAEGRVLEFFPVKEEDAQLPMPQMISLTDMIHYLDVRNGWDPPACQCCLERAVGYRGQRTLGLQTFENFQTLVSKSQFASVPQAPENSVSLAILKHSAGVPVPGETWGPLERFCSKAQIAPFMCAQGMLLEWLAEPRVGLLMDLGKVRSRLQEIFAGSASAASSPASSATTEPSAASAAAAPSSCCWRCSSCWAAYRRALSFATFFVLVARWPRFVTLWRVHMDSGCGILPALVGELGGMRLVEEDSFASMLVQILGLKEEGDSEEGFGSHMQHLLSGGVEKGHAQGGFAATGSTHEIKNADGGRRKGKEVLRGEELCGGVRRRDINGLDDQADNGEWREHLRGPVWERYVDGMGGILKGGGGEGRAFRCSHCCGDSGSVRGSTSGGSGCVGDDGSSSVADSNGGGGGVPKGMYLSGVGATDFALTVATVFSQPQHWNEAQSFSLNGSNAAKTRVENVAIEAAREKLKKDMGAGGSASAKAKASDRALPTPERAPVTTYSVVAAMTYRASCILTWVRIYGSNSILGKQCLKDSSQSKVLPMRHPLRDLPNLLFRLGDVPKPLEGDSSFVEWEEWPQGDAAAARFPIDPRARCFGLGVVEEGRAAEKGGRAPSKQPSAGAGNSKTVKARGPRTGGKVRMVKLYVGKVRKEVVVALPAPRAKFPIVRCRADIDFLVKLAGSVMEPPACSQCLVCIHSYSRSVATAALIATFAYRPVSILFNRVVSLFPRHSFEYMKLQRALCFPECIRTPVSVLVMQERAEEMPIAFLMTVAVWWSEEILGIKELMQGRGALMDARGKAGKRGTKAGKGKGGEGGKGEEDGGEVWEEVRMWCLVATMAWQPIVWLKDVREPCSLGKEQQSSGCEEVDFSWLLKEAIVPRFCEELESVLTSGHSGGDSNVNSDDSIRNIHSSSGSGSGISRSGTTASSSSSGRSQGRGSSCSEGKCEVEVPAYLKPWPGGVNVVACLREMLLGEPCYLPPSHAASSIPPACPITAASTVPAASSTPAAGSTPAPSSSPAAHSSHPASLIPAGHCTPAALSSSATPPAALAGGMCDASVTHSTTDSSPASAPIPSERDAPFEKGRLIASCGRRVCGADGCGKMEGGRGGVKLKGCGACGKVAYCSRDCQKAHWPSHKLTCPGRSSSRGSGVDGSKTSGLGRSKGITNDSGQDGNGRGEGCWAVSGKEGC